MRPLLVLYSVWYWSISIAWMALVALPLTAIARILSPGGRLQAALPQRSMSVVPRLNFLRFRVHKDPGFDPEAPCVYAFNHVNLMDGFTCCVAIERPFVGLMNAWQLHVPIYGWVMRLAHGIGVPRSPLERARSLPKIFRERASRGLSVVTYPEGHRTLDGTVAEFKRGVTQLARGADLPITPVAVRGMFPVMQKGSMVVRPGGRVDIWIGPTLPTAGLSKKEMTELTKRLEEMVRHYVVTGEPLQGIGGGQSTSTSVT